MTRILTTLSFLAAASTVSAADIENGAELHADNCVRCHSSSVYTRDDRNVQSLAKLGTQVRMCKNNLGLTWFDDEVNDVIHYLNNEHYNFK